MNCAYCGIGSRHAETDPHRRCLACKHEDDAAMELADKPMGDDE